MSEPIEDRLRSLATDTNPMPPPPSDIRRRGERLRRRNHVLALAGGALVVGLVAGPILNLADIGKATPAPTTPPHGVAAADVLTVADLPSRDRLAEWEEATPNGATLACVPPDVIENLAAEDTVDRRFGAFVADSPSSGPYAAEIRETVLAFDSDEAATAAHQSVASWINDCDAPDLVGKLKNEQRAVKVAGAVGFWELFLRSANDVCDECDAVRFDRQAAIRIDSRLVLLSLSEIGGPLEPDGLDESMRQLVTTAVAKGAPEGDAETGQSPTE